MISQTERAMKWMVSQLLNVDEDGDGLTVSSAICGMACIGCQSFLLGLAERKILLLLRGAVWFDVFLRLQFLEGQTHW